MLTPKQKELRRTGIGGSDVAAITGHSRYKTPLQVCFDKWGHAYEENDEIKEHLYWGHRLEPVIAEEYQIRTNAILAIPEKMYRSEKYPFMIANIDRLIVNSSNVKSALECKTCSAFKYKEWGSQGTDEIPDEYLLQCAHYAIVLDLDFVDIALLMGGQRFAIFKYERNLDFERHIITAEDEFWHKYVLEKIPPACQTYEDAMLKFPGIEGVKISANEEIQKSIRKFKKLKRLRKIIDKRLDDTKVNVCEYMGNATELVDHFGNKLVTWNKTQNGRRFLLKEVA